MSETKFIVMKDAWGGGMESPKFVLTKHAKQRMIDRGIMTPDYRLNLKPTGKKLRRLIRERCALRGYDFDKVYWVHNQRVVYVCELIEVAKYLVITAFDLKDGTK